MATTPNMTMLQDRENLALSYQEILTAISRLRVSRQATIDAGAFRSSMKASLLAAEADATRKRYTPEDARLATFAVVAFLDESVESTRDPNFADWSRRRMQEEFFGHPATDEVFFQCIDRLLARGDSREDADVLEVFGICLLLGYRGRYRAGGPEDVRRLATTIDEKVQSIRGPRRLDAAVAPAPDAVMPPPQDPWVRPLVFGTLGALFLAALFFAGFKFALLSGTTELHAIRLLAPH